MSERAPAPVLTKDGGGAARAGAIDHSERLRLLIEAIRDLGARHGRAPLLERLPDPGALRTDGLARVVVAGETKTGKSSLVNALLGHPDLSPVGVDVTTNCAITFTAGSPESARVLLAAADAACADPVAVHAEPVSVAHAPLFASVAGLATLAAEGRAQAGEVVAVEVVLDAPLLDGIALTDTPGIGGLTGAHGAITARMLDGADALLFVSDGTAPLLAPEVEFLARALDHVGAVVVAVTKGDATDREVSEQLIAESRETMRRHDARLAAVTFFPVSSRRAELAAGFGPDRSAAADRMRSLSGLGPLRDWLAGEVRGRADGLRLLGQARGALAVLSAMRAAELGTAAALTEAPEGWAALQSEQARIAAYVADPQAVRVDVAHRMARFRQQPRHALDADVRAIRDTYRARAVGGPKGELASLPAELQAALAVAADARLRESETMAAELGTALAAALGNLQIADEVTVAGAGSGWDVGTPGSPVKAKGAAAFGALGMLGLGGMAGNYAAIGLGILAVPTAGIAVALAATAGGIAGLARWRFKASDEAQLRNHLNNWVAAACNEMRGLFAAELERRALAVQQYVEVTLPKILADRNSELKAVFDEIKALEASTRKERTAIRAEHKARLAEIEKLVAAAEALVAELAAGPGLAGPAPS